MTPKQILALTDTCVKCGLCLPHCPTYRKTAQEPDSPRGRIALIQGLLTAAIPDTPHLTKRLSRCLECHACESACPSKVPVTHIIDATRAVQMERQPSYKRWLRYRLLNLAVRPAPLIPWVRYYQRSWLRSWLQRSGILRFLQLEHADQLLPTHLLTASNTSNFPAQNKKLGTIAIFPGCLGRFLDAPALNAATTVLTRMGYSVSIPRQPCCCGALHRHDGFAAQGDSELAQTASLLERHEHVLTLASACLAELQAAPSLAKSAKDASRFIANLTWSNELIIDTTPQTIWVHTPCTQRYPIKDPQAAIDLLARIPGVTPLPLPENEICCGAAGTYMLRQPKLSLSLLADKMRLIKATGATVIVTTNTGCALRLAAGLRTQGIETRVCHPLEILAERLR